MVKTCNKHLHVKFLSISLNSFYAFFLNHLSLAVADNSPSEFIFLACGSSDSFKSQDNRSWIGDNNSQYFPLFEPQNNLSVASSELQPSLSNMENYYLKARFSHSRFTYIFNLTAGPKFIRLYFYPTSYSNFDSSKTFFSVKAGSFTLLNNFSASLTAAATGQDAFFKEFCIYIEDQRLNITFTPGTPYQKAYAFINAIEIVCMPIDLYYTPVDKGFKILGQENTYYRIERGCALETVYRLNVGGRLISVQQDTGMYRLWSNLDYLIRQGFLLFNYTIDLNFSKIRNYTAPKLVYQTAMSISSDKENYDLTWEFPVDSGFTYVVRLHFCEFRSEIFGASNRVFEIDIANQTAEPRADVIEWSGGIGVPYYKDYAVTIDSKEIEKKQNLSIALLPAPEQKTKNSDALLNGIEIFKVDNEGNLSGPNPDALITSPPVTSPSPKSTKHKTSSTIIISIVGIVLSSIVFVLSIAILFIFRRKWKKRSKASVPISFPKDKSSKPGGSSQPSDLSTYFSLSEIKAATNNFDDVLIIGVGGFGNVYKGWLINNEATPVAIKRLNPGSQQGALEFKTEIEMLSQLRHRHLVSLIGYCDDGGEMILVYDYMARGTLRDHLYNGDNPPLPWHERLKICIGAAHGLNYLHTGAKHIIIHRDVKTTNILLDEKWDAKVSDFGLSKIGPTTMSQTHVSTMVKGSFGYLDPEYFLLQELTEKSDVYSFGVVLFEVLSARRPVLRGVDRKQASLAIWAQECYNNGTFDQVVDPFLKDKIGSECLKKFGKVATSCLHEDRNKRPSMSEVVYGLEFALQIQNSKEKDEELGEIDKGKLPVENYVSDEDSDLLFTDYLEY